MSKSRSELLCRALGIESEQPLEEAPTAVDIDPDELLEPLPTVSEIHDEAIRADVVADKLEEIAEKADLLVEQDQDTVANAAVLQMAVESLMSSHNLPYLGTGMENARGPKMLLVAVADEARRSAQVLRTYSLESLSYSSEGMLSRLLGFDRRAFSGYRQTLVEAERDIDSMSQITREARVLINHKGIFQFLAQNGRPVADIVGSFKSEIKWLDDSRNYIEQSLKVLEQAANIIALAQQAEDDAVAAAVKKLKSLSLPSNANLERSAGNGLLNNATYTLTMDGKAKTFTNLVCPVGSMSREDITSSDVATTFQRVAGAMGGWYLGGMAGGVAGAITGIVFGPVGAVIVGFSGAIGGAVGVVKKVDSNAAGKSLKSAFGVPELKQVIDLAKGLDKHVGFEFDGDAVDKKLNGKPPAALSEAYSVVIHSVVALHSLSKDLYDQAARDLKGVAALTQKIVSEYKSNE